MSSALVSHLERDARLIRIFMLVRTSLVTHHGASVQWPGIAQPSTMDFSAECEAIDAALMALGCLSPNDR